LFSNENLEIDLTALGKLPLNQAKIYIINKLKNVLTPLYSAVDNDIPFKNYSNPCRFVSNQIGRILDFLAVNYEIYVVYCNVNSFEEYHEHLERAAVVGGGNAMLELEFNSDSDNTLSNNVLAALSMAEAFFDELDELFLMSTYNIIYNSDKIIDILLDNYIDEEE
jgi:hypothetical protein